MSYYFASAKIRVLEKRLLDEIDVKRMVEAKNANDAFQVLNDTDISDNILNREVYDFEIIIQDDIAQLKDLIKNISPDKNLFALLFLKYDFHNIKVILKSKISGQDDFLNELTILGIYDSDDLKEYIFNQNYKTIVNSDFKKSLDKIIELALPENIDLVCDQEYFNLLYGYAKKIGNLFIENFVKIEIDLANLRIALSSEKSSTFFYIPNGNITKEEFTKINSNKEEIVSYLKKRFAFSQKNFFQNYFTERKLWQLERDFDNFLIDYIKNSKRISFGPEVILSYVKAKEIAFGNIRLIMAAKLNSIETHLIKERIRNVF